METLQGGAARELRPAVGYIRMSTDKQEDSPKRQRGEIEQLAAKEGFYVARWYEDHGLTGTESMNRPEFRQLLRDAEIGTFEAVLMYEQSRMSREDVFAQMEHLRCFFQANIELWTVQRGQVRLTDLGGLITAIVEADASHGESIKTSKRSTSGRRKAFHDGRRVGGGLFGYDRELVDDRGEVLRVHFRERFQKPKSWTMRLVVSDDQAAVDAVRFMFERVAAGNTYHSIAMALNRMEVTTSRGKPFVGSAVREIVENEAYLGVERIGMTTTGKFSSVSEGTVLRRENAHPPIVSQKLFDAAKRSIEDRRDTRADGRRFYTLTGFVICGHCGGKMTGHITFSRGKKNKAPKYACKGTEGKKCPKPTIRAEVLESAIAETLQQLFGSEESFRMINDAMMRMDEQLSHLVAKESAGLQVLETKIAKAKQNLAFAARQKDFDRIGEMIDNLEAEAEALRESMRQKIKRTHRKLPGPFIKDAASYQREFAKLLPADLRAVFESFLDHVAIRVESISKARHHHLVGEIVLVDDLGVPPIPIESATSQMFKFQEVAMWIAERDHPVSPMAIMERFKISRRVAMKRLAFALRDGLVKPSGRRYVAGPRLQKVRDALC